MSMAKEILTYRDLVAWQKAVELVTHIYKLTRRFPKHELFGLTSQIRRAAVSIPSNIAEGRGKSSKGEFQQYLYHASGSLYELETQLVIAKNLGYLQEGEDHQLHELAAETGRVLNGLLASIKSK
jgi:four helix bundle protein